MISINKYDNDSYFKNFVEHWNQDKARYMILETVTNFIEDITNKKILDMGSGMGNLVHLLAQKGADRVIGIDNSHNMIEYANKHHNHPQVEYKHADILDCNYNEEFDVIVSTQCIHKIENFESFIQLAYNWLKPGGEFILSVVHPASWSSGLKNYFDEGPHEHNRLGNVSISYHRTIGTYTTTLLNAGFTIKGLQEIPYSFKPLPEFIIFKVKK